MKRVLLTLLLTSLLWASAQDGGALMPGDTVEGEATDSEVTFKFGGVAGETVGFRVEADFPALLRITDSDGRTLKTSEDLSYTGLPLTFTAQEDAAYTLVIGTVYGEPSGAYELEMTSETVVPVAYGDEVERLPDPEGIFAYFFRLEAAEGDVLNIYASSEDDDLELRVFLPDGTEVAEDDDDGPAFDPYIRRFIVPTTSSYLITAAPASDRNVVETPFTLYVEQTELLFATQEPTSIVLGGEVTGDTDTEVFVFDDVDPRAVYRLVIATDSSDTSLSVEATQGGDDLTQFFIDDSLRTSVDLVARTSSRMFVLIDDTRFRNAPIEYSVSLSLVE